MISLANSGIAGDENSKSHTPAIPGEDCRWDGLYPCPDRTRRVQEELVNLEQLFSHHAGGTEHRDHVSPTAEDWWDRFVDNLHRTPGQEPPQTWTVLFYDDADFFNAYDPFEDFVADVRPDSNVNALVLRDRFLGMAGLYRVDEYQNAIYLENWLEPNMGSFATLRDFIAYGKAHYPADRYLLALYDHGGGWLGACTDETNHGWLLMDDIARALDEAGGVDIICFTAPCTMGALESVYELRDCVDVYIGSEDLSGYIFWRGIMGDICDILNDSAHLTSDEISESIIQLVDANPSSSSEWLTMSAVDASKVSDVAQSVEFLVQHAIENIGDMHQDISTARELVWQMGRDGTYPLREVDLYDLAAQLSAITPDTTSLRLLSALMDTLERAVIAECRGAGQPRAHGLSIYFPKLSDEYNERYVAISLDFAADTGWDEFLNVYYANVVPVYLQQYASYWREDHAEITWILTGAGDNAELEFRVSRRCDYGRDFVPLAAPEIVEEGSAYTCLDYTVEAGRTYVYRVEVIEDGVRATSFETELRTPRYSPPPIQSYPNPFNSTSTISYSVQREGRVGLCVYDIGGRLIRTLVDGQKSPGDYEVKWSGRRTDGTAVPSGIYFVRLETRGQAQTRKIVVLR
jgi:hypothetical protein